jgi:hypothetical protein
VKYKKNKNKYEFDDNTSSDYDISIISGKYFNRDTKDSDDGNLLFPSSSSFPLPSYLGSFARRTVEDFEGEKSNLIKNNWSSLKKGNLRGDINDLWIKCFDKQGDYKCGNVTHDVEEYEKQIQIQTAGGRKTKRRHKKTRKHTRKQKIKTKRREKRKSRKLFVLKKGHLTKYGYHADLSESVRHEALKKALGEYTPLSLFRKLNAVYVLNKNRDKKRAAIFKADANWVKMQ